MHAALPHRTARQKHIQMGRPFIDFAALKAAVTMTQLLEHYGLMATMTPKKNGEALEGPCPIHKGTDRSQFKVSIPKNCWNCFSECRCGGNVLDFVARMEGCDAQEAAIRINGWFGLGLEKQPSSFRKEDVRPSGVVQTPVREGVQGMPPHAAHEEEPDSEEPNPPLGFALKDLETEHPYLAQRGLSREAVSEFGLGFCRRGTMAGRIAIPIHDADGALVGYAGRLPGQPDEKRPKYKFPAGFRKSCEVFGLYRALRESPDSPLIVVEGFFDCMRLWELGWRQAVSIMGSHLSSVQERLLAEAAKESGIILLFDEDDAGRAGRLKALLRLATQAFVKAVPLPREGAQPDHLTREELNALLA